MGPPSNAPEPIRAERRSRSDDRPAARGRRRPRGRRRSKKKVPHQQSSISLLLLLQAPPPQQQRAAAATRSSSSRSAADDASSSSSLLSQPGPQAAGRPRGNPLPPSDSGTHTDEAASKPLNNGVVLKSDDKKTESPSVKKSSKQTELVQKPIRSRHGQDKKDRCQTGSNQEDDDRLGAPDLLSSLTGFGGSAVNKTSQAGSFLTGGLRPDAKAELDEKEEISQTGSNQEDDDRLGAPDLLSSLTGFGGSAVNKTSQAGSFLTGGLRPDAKAELDEKEEISQTGSNQEDDDRLGAPDLLSSLTGFGGSAVNKTSQAGSFLTGGLRPDAKAELDEKEEISQTGSNQEDDDRLGAPDLLSSLTGFGGSAVNKTSQAGSFLTGGLRPDAKAELDEKEEISHNRV